MMISKSNETKIKPQILRDHKIFVEIKIANDYVLSEEENVIIRNEKALNIFGIIFILSKAERFSLQLYIKSVLMRRFQSSYFVDPVS